VSRQTTTRVIFLFSTIVIAIFLFLISKQRSSSANLPPTPTLDFKATQSVQTATQKAIRESTSQVATRSAQMTQESQATNTAWGQTATAQADAELKTQVFATLQTAIFNATAEALPLQTFVQTIFDQGVITSANGYYIRLPDFENTWNKSGRYQWWDTNYQVTNFVLMADLAWDSATPQFGRVTSGCGFIFSENGTEDQHRVFLTLDGTTHLYRQVNGLFAQVKERYYDHLDIPGNAQIALVVEKGWVSFYVNNEQVFKVEDTTITNGGLAYAISSGTSEGYGVRCTMTQIGLWTLEN
jgi:hypothetical protein